MHHIVRPLQDQNCTHMICVVQHNMKICILCTGVEWLALPAAIALNYHLALITIWCA